MYALNRKDFDRYLTESEERKLFAEIKRHMHRENVAGLLAMRDYYAFKLMRNTGIRVGSLVGMQVADATAAIQNKTLTLHKDIVKGKKRAHHVYCNAVARVALKQLIRIRRDLGRPLNGDGRLLVSRQSDRMSIRTVQQRIEFWRNQAALQSAASPHWLRHTFAKRIIKHSTASDPQKTVQALLNHSDPRSTVIYTLPDKEEIAAAAEEAAG